MQTMSSFLALSPKDCQPYRWLIPADMAFAQQQALLPLHAGEMGQVAASMPLALHHKAGQWQLVAVCGLSENHNLYIKDGQWLGQYRPLWLQTYPFAMMPVGDKAYAVFDRDSGLLQSNGEGEAFFDGNGQLTPATAERVALLQTHFGRQQRTQQAVDLLVKLKLLVPWPEELMKKTGQHVQGLHMVDEKALHQLDDASFLSLRKAQALPIAYAVNFSMAQQHLLARLQKINPPPATAMNLDQVFSNAGSDTLKFNF